MRKPRQLDIPEYYSLAEAAKIFLRTPSALSIYKKKHGHVYGLTPVHIGHRVYLDKISVDRMARGLPVEQEAAK
jgi:hypothetical protein